MQLQAFKSADINRVGLALVTFGLGLSIPEEEMDLCERLTRPAWIHICLTNDLYSWEKEYQAFLEHGKTQTFNAIWVLTREHSLTVDEAKKLCRHKIKENVAAYLRNVEESRNNENLSLDLRKYIECMQYQIRGNLVWSMLAPRYNLAASFNESQLLRMRHGLKKYPIRSYEEVKASETKTERDFAIKSKTLTNCTHPSTNGVNGVNGASHHDVNKAPQVNGTNGHLTDAYTYGVNGVNDASHHNVKEAPKVNGFHGVLTNGPTPRAHKKTESVFLDLNLHGLGDEVCVTDFPCFSRTFIGLSR